MVFRRAAGLLVLVLLAAILPSISGAQAPSSRFSVLVFSKTEGFRHDSIAAGITAIEKLGAENDFAVTATERAGSFNDANLSQFDAVVFLNTTGDVLNERQQSAFERYIKSGGGFVGVHSAADTEYDWPFYGKLLGAWFKSHPKRQNATLYVADRSHPSTAHLPARWSRHDEWYNFRRNPRGKVHVLMTIDERTYVGGKQMMGADHPIAWCRDFRGGRMWYTGLGHTQETYSEPAFLQHLLGGIETGAGAVGADCTGTIWKKFTRAAVSPAAEEPMSLAVTPGGDVLFVERGGTLKRWRPATGVTQFAGRLSVRTKGEDGLLGIAIDPGFALNSWIYLYYSPKGVPVVSRLSRFTLEASGIDMGSEQTLLEIPTESGCCHAAGSLAFDPAGNLYLSTGDATNPFQASGFAPIDERKGRSHFDAQRSAANTNDLRGKILRIRPLPDGSYTIPTGNLFGLGAPKARPEIYAMGLRNPFRISIDSATGRLYFGDIGPDARASDPARGPRGVDEWNRTTTAGNFGWPYCVGPNRAYRDYDFAAERSGARFNCDAPANDSPNNIGAATLPPARPAWLSFPYAISKELPILGSGPRAAMAGPVYPTEGGMFPAYYRGVFFAFDWARGRIYEVREDESGEMLVINPFLGAKAFKHPIDVELGPDGVMYVLDYGLRYGSGRDSGLYRIAPDTIPPPSVLHLTGRI